MSQLRCDVPILENVAELERQLGPAGRHIFNWETMKETSWTCNNSKMEPWRNCASTGIQGLRMKMFDRYWKCHISKFHALILKKMVFKNIKYRMSVDIECRMVFVMQPNEWRTVYINSLSTRSEYPSTQLGMANAIVEVSEIGQLSKSIQFIVSWIYNCANI